MSIGTLRGVIGPLAAAALLLLLLAALHLMSEALQNSVELNRYFIPLLLFIAVGLFTLMLLVGISIVQMILRYRRQAAGSGLTLRMVALFVTLSIAPVAIVFAYSQQLLSHGIDNWFDVRIDQAMEDALELSRASLSLHQRERLRSTQQLIGELEGLSITALTLSLNTLRERYGATELLLMDGNGQIITSSNVDPTQLVPNRPDSAILHQVHEEGSFVSLAPQEEDILQVRVVVTAPRRPYLLQALYPTSLNVTLLTERVEQAYNHYKELSYLRNSLKSAFTITLSLVLLFSILAATWAALYASRRLVAPIIEIAAGTHEVADGHYGLQLPPPRFRDELAFLVASFNSMSRRIEAARDAADRSQHALETQHAYLEAVLGGLSSGVIAFDDAGQLKTANPAAHLILGLDPERHLRITLHELQQHSNQLQPFVSAIEEALRSNHDEWQGEITLHRNSGRQVLLCRLTPLLRPSDPQSGGHVLLFDDVTQLLQAQRDAAWGGVARRLAHEIKNPLTPIQLSAERLRHKLLEQLSGDNAAILDRATHTIVAQVEAMKLMLDTFSDYARPPKLHPQPLLLDPLLDEVLELYRNDPAGVLFESRLQAATIHVNADPLRMRQLFHNLLKNAREAVLEQLHPQIHIQTRFVELHDYRYLEIAISDNGPGFSTEILPRLFEPYFTTKARGTGLGLAIVKKIIEEHGGLIHAENIHPTGALLTLRLPVLVEEDEQELRN